MYRAAAAVAAAAAEGGAGQLSTDHTCPLARKKSPGSLGICISTFCRPQDILLCFLPNSMLMSYHDSSTCISGHLYISSLPLYTPSPFVHTVQSLYASGRLAPAQYASLKDLAHETWLTWVDTQPSRSVAASCVRQDSLAWTCDRQGLGFL